MCPIKKELKKAEKEMQRDIKKQRDRDNFILERVKSRLREKEKEA